MWLLSVSCSWPELSPGKYWPVEGRWWHDEGPLEKSHESIWGTVQETKGGT